ncbi:uncharacterized protein [Ptychodera flava]|uniref:uncharacterized protein n=1 Tax=Ptychodera flava TaxID=63121 RepID=UPI003969DD00
MAKTETLLFFLLIAIVATPQHAASNLVRFKPGVVYKYEYKARTAIEKAGVISVKAEIGIKLLEDTDRGQHCQLLIRSIVYYLHSPNADEETLGKYNNITEFSKWFSFTLSDYGEIHTVYYPENDQAWVIIVKKLLIGAYSAKLHSTEGTLSKGVPWSYRVNETGHEGGGHEAIYTVKQVDQGLLFRKTKYGHVVPRANASLDKFPIPRTPLSEIQMDIESNMTCMQMHQHSPGDSHRCFRSFCNAHSPGSSRRPGAVVPAPNATLVTRALTHYVGLDRPPSTKSIQAIYKLAFRKIDTLQDLAEENIVHNRAVLVLGSVAKCLRSADQGDDRQKGDQIVREMEDQLGVHDPWHQRRKRATLTPEDFRDFLEKKATLIYSLGNAVYLSSFEHLFSYLNDSESHPMLRRSAVHAISRFELQEAVETLMMSALYDDDKTVRHLARIEYFRHPFVIEDDEITGMFNRNVSRAATVPRLERIRRSILTRLSFDFKLEIPGIHWTKSVGNKDIGADVGLILRNKFELEISPSEGHAEIDIYDHAYAKAHVGFFNWEYSLLDAKVCFYGKVGYNINILQEFGYEDIAELAKLFDEVVNDIIPPLKQSIVSFKEALAPDSVPITEIFRDLIDAVRDLPVQVGDFRNVSKDAVSMIGKYRGLPDSVYELQEVILRLSSLFSAVKTDAMDLYHDINEAVTVILPWAAEQIQKSVKASSDALNEMFKSPVSSIRDISRFFRLIKDVISALVKEVINKIEAALAFSDGDKPFWFDLDAQIDVIWNDLQAVANQIEIENSKNWTSRDDDAIKQLTGISEETVREQIIDDVRGLVEILAEPTDRLKIFPNRFKEPMMQYTFSSKP